VRFSLQSPHESVKVVQRQKAGTKPTDEPTSSTATG